MATYGQIERPVGTNWVWSAFIWTIRFDSAREIDYAALSSRMTMPRIPSMWETQAELYMEGLKTQHDELSKTLKDNEQLVMICWHGHDKLQVISISMPSDNVVAMRCIDETSATIQVTGHMNALTFSFRIHTIIPPAVRKPIGFEMPQSE